VISIANYSSDTKKIIQRLKRIEGQVRGIQRMIADDQYCIDILTQIAAARSALNQVGLIILEEHSHTCLIEAIQDNRSEAIEEFMDALKRFMK